MMVCQMCLCRVEELPHTIAGELRPALAVRDPAVLFIDWVRHVLGQYAAGTTVRPAGPALVRGLR